MKTGGFIPVGVQGINSKIKKLIKDNIITDPSNIQKVLEKYCPEVLICYDLFFGKTTKYSKINQKLFNYMTMLKTGNFQNIPIRLDSGGYQINSGRYDYQKSMDLFHYYYDYIANYNQVIDKAFVLDMPPSDKDKLFTSWKQVEDLNRQSYSIAKELNKDQKMIFVFHMASREIESIWTDLLEEYYDDYSLFSVGGIAANIDNSSSRAVNFMLALYKTMKATIKRNKTSLNFHYLGGGQYQYILIFELFKKFFKEMYGITINFTFDSSGYLLLLTQSKMYPHWNGELKRVVPIKFKEHELSNMLDGMTYKMTLIDLLNIFSNNHNLDINIRRVYTKEGKMNHVTHFLTTLLYYESYNRIIEYSSRKANELFDLYMNHDIEEFVKLYIDTHVRLNIRGFLTRDTKKTATDMYKCLDLFKTMNDDHYYHVFNKSALTINKLNQKIMTI
jgi:hypothetical protein